MPRTKAGLPNVPEGGQADVGIATDEAPVRFPWLCWAVSATAVQMNWPALPYGASTKRPRKHDVPRGLLRNEPDNLRQNIFDGAHVIYKQLTYFGCELHRAVEFLERLEICNKLVGRGIYRSFLKSLSP